MAILRARTEATNQNSAIRVEWFNDFFMFRLYFFTLSLVISFAALKMCDYTLTMRGEGGSSPMGRFVHLKQDLWTKKSS